MLYLACRTLLTVLTIVLEVYGEDPEDPGKRVTAVWAMAITCVVCSMMLAFGFLWYIPYYNFRYAIFRAGLMLNFFWASLCFLFTVVRPHSDIGIVYLALTPIVFILSGFLVISRRKMVKEIPIHTINDPFVLELQIRFKLMDAGLLYRDSSNPTERDMEAGGAGQRNAANAASGISIGGYRQMNGISTEKEMNLMDEIVEAFVIAGKHMTKSCMLQLFAGSFHLIHLNNRAQCLATYSKAETMNPRMDESFMIYRRQRLLNERFSGGDVIDFIAFEQNMQNARKYEKKATLAIIHFWSELLKRQPSFQRLQGHGATISSAISSAQSHYLALIKLSPDAPQVYRLYGHFLINLLNDGKQGQDLLDHADELEEEHQRGGDQNGEEMDGESIPNSANLDLLSEDNAVITISGELSNLGHIININAMTTKLFGYKKGELIQQNINKLLPSPFSESHDMFLRKYLETGFAKVIDRARQVLGVNKQGFLFPLTLCVKHLVDAKGMQSFIGIIRPQPESETQGFIIMNSSLEILHFSKNIGMIFGAKPKSSFADDVENLPKLSDWIPNTTIESTPQFLNKSGMKLQYTSNGGTYDIVIHGDNVQLTGVACYICRMKFKIETANILNGQNSEEKERRMSTLGNNDEPLPSACPFSDKYKVGVTPPHPLTSSNINESSESLQEMPMAFSGSMEGVQVRLPSTSDIHLRAPSNNSGSKVGSPLASGAMRRKGSFATPGELKPIVKKTALMVETSGKEKQPPGGAKNTDQDQQSLNGKDDDRESLGSRGSKATSAKSFVKRIISLKNEKSNRRLQWLNLAFVMSIIVLTIIAIIECVEYRTLYEGVDTTLWKIMEQNDLSVRVVQLAYSARDLDLLRNPGWFWNTSKCAEDIPTAKSRLDRESIYLRNHAGVFTTCLSPFVAPRDIYGNRDKLMRPFDALQSSLSSSRFLVGALSNDSSMLFEAANVFQNSPFEVLRAVNACSTQDMDGAFRIGRHMPQQLLSLACIAPCLYIIIQFFVIQPLYMRIEDNKEKFLRMFYDIPKEVVKGIYESHFQRVLAAAEEEESDQEGDLANKFALEKVFASLQQLDKAGVEKSGQKTNRKGNIFQSDLSEPIANPVLRWMYKASHDHHRVFLKSLAILLATCLHFFVIGGLSYLYLSNVDDVGTQVYWSSQRQIVVRQSSFFVREAFIDIVRNVSTTRFPTAQQPVELGIPNSYQLARQKIIDLGALENGLLFGNADLNLDGMLDKGYSDPLVVLEFQMACLPESPSDCATFDNSVMSRGLYAATTWYQKKAQNILANITSWNPSTTSSQMLENIDSAIASLRKFDDEYLDPAYIRASEYYMSGMRQVITWFSSFNLAFTVTYILLLLVIFVLLIRPLIRALGEDLKRTAALVYMLPSEVFSRVPSFKNWAEKHLHGSRPKDSKPDSSPAGEKVV
ncbi:hypothetical protein HDU97_000715 [Phlyctochytrium planicorne]|nr:hypothetical protein HDU97_000715 [Phlyctochytrium planicorne]